MSLLTQDELKSLYALLQKYNVTMTQITPAQKLVIYGLDESTAQLLLQDLDDIFAAPGATRQNGATQITSLRCCPDPDQCKYSITSSKNLGRILNSLTFSKPFPHKVKIAISACSMCCTEPLVRDVGIVAHRGGWKIFFGGNAGGRPRIADLIATNLNQEDVVTMVIKLLNFYTENATKKQRTARFVESFGIDAIKKNILK